MSKKKKVVFVIPRMGAGGAERVVANIANSLSERDYEVRIITLVSDESFYPLKDKVVIKSAMLKTNRLNKTLRYLSMAKNLYKAFFYIRKEIKQYNPNTVVSMLIEADLLTHLVKRSGVSFKHVCSERNDPSIRSKYLSKYLHYIYRNADVLICQGRKVAHFYSKVSESKVAIIPNPINHNLIPSSTQEKDALSIVAVGRLDPQKNFSLLIDSFYDVNKEFPNCTLTIYGEGSLRTHLQKRITSYGLVNRVFLPGSRKDVLNDIKSATLFVMSSNHEGFPNSLVEAMAVGLPIISTDFSTGIARELIKEDNGIVIPVGDRKAMGNAIKEILSDDKLRNRMRVENRKIISELSIENIVTKWERVL